MAVDWTDPRAKISTFFTVKEALWLPQWKRMATVKDGLGPTQQENLIKVFRIMDQIRGLFGKPVLVHVAFRPYSYNKLIGGAPKSSHVQGMAVDFHVDGVDCDVARAKLMPKLEEWGLRMENLPGSSWIHIDTRPVPPGGNRFFKP